MKHDPRSFDLAPRAGQVDVQGPTQRRQDAPENRRGGVTHYRTVAEGEARSHELTLFAEPEMPHGIDASVDAMQAPTALPPHPRRARYPVRLELRRAHQSMLSR